MTFEPLGLYVLWLALVAYILLITGLLAAKEVVD